jgi:hypothetical protein
MPRLKPLVPPATNTDLAVKSNAAMCALILMPLVGRPWREVGPSLAFTNPYFAYASWLAGERRKARNASGDSLCGELVKAPTA